MANLSDLIGHFSLGAAFQLQQAEGRCMPADTRKQPLPHDLLALYDEFAELDACYAFFCDAVAAISSKEYLLGESSAEGLRFFSQWLKEKSAAFKGELNATWLAASSHERH